MSSKPAFNSAKKEYNASHNIMRGVAWSILMRWSIRFIGLFSTLILARLLTPDDFGVVAMGMLVVHFLSGLSEFGTSMHLIRAKEIDDAHCDTAWTITLLQGTFTAAGLLIIAQPASVYFSEPRVIEVMYLLALAELVGGFANIGPTLLRRELKFALDFRFNVIKKVFIFITTVTCAVVFRNYWALAIGHLAGVAAGVVLSYVMHSYRPRWSLAYGWEYFRFGMSVIPLRMANAFRGMAPTFLVAGAGNTAMLGTFRVASDLSKLFTTEIVTPMGRGLLPNYSRLADRPDELSQMYRKILGMVAMVCFPVGVGVAAVAQDLTLVLLGPQWGFAADLMQYLAIGAAIFAFSVAMVNQILVATGHEKAAALLAWVRLGITVPILWAGLQLGDVVGLALATIVAPIACLPFIYRETRRAVTLPLSALFGLVWRPLVSAAVMFFAVKTIHVAELDWAILRLFTDALVGGGVFIATVLGLWVISGRPASAESTALGLVGKAMSKLRARYLR